VEVEIDPDTCVIKLMNYTAVDDVGTVINPMIVEGQLHGGIVQGIGQALYETASMRTCPGNCSRARSWIIACRAQTTCRA